VWLTRRERERATQLFVRTHGSYLMEEFGYEQLDVYQRSIELLTQSYRIVDSLLKERATPHLPTNCDQFRRPSLSIPLNIAEGTGKCSAAEGSRFYQIARRSALECSAIINCCLILKLVDTNLLATAKTLVFKVVQMLSKLVLR